MFISTLVLLSATGVFDDIVEFAVSNKRTDAIFGGFWAYGFLQRLQLSYFQKCENNHFI